MEKRYIEPATHLDDETPWNLVEADFTKLSGECGFLSYSYFDAAGQSISPPTGVFWERSFSASTDEIPAWRVRAIFRRRFGLRPAGRWTTRANRPCGSYSCIAARSFASISPRAETSIGTP